MDFSKPYEILEVLLAKDRDYRELADVADTLLDEIDEPHENFDGIKFPSAMSQCIFECFKRIHNFSSSRWVSQKKLSNPLNPGVQPIIFSRISARGDLCEYEVYNSDQIVFENDDSDSRSGFNPTTNAVGLKPDLPQDDIKNVILACAAEFSGSYGRSGIAHILRGSQSLKDNDFNQNALNSGFFGILHDETKKFIISQIDELLEEGKLGMTKGSFGRPLLVAKAEAGAIEFSPAAPAEAEEEDENLAEITKLIRQGKNIFITGHAGTGKSYILNKLKEKFKKLVVTSTTGIAAVNVKGQTLHSWAGVGICNKPIDKAIEDILNKSSIKRQIQKCKMLAIDEISMLNVETFEYVDEVLRKIRACAEPFGGIQVIFIGDFFQLPPVEGNRESRISEGSKYCFESKLWEELDLQTIQLTKNYRQDEADLIAALSNMRVNSLTDEDIALLRTRETDIDTHQTDILHIFATNEEANRYNEIKFRHLDSREYRLCALDGVYHSGEFISSAKNQQEEFTLKRLDETCRAERDILLKIGCRVMLLINLDFDKGLINGSCGAVEEISDSYVLVRFDNGCLYEIQKHDFEYYRNDVLIAARKQFPLKLAYGITIHKSQGMTLEKLVVDCNRIFEKGQAYVALSRIKKLEGLYLKSFHPNKVMADERIVEFYRNTINK